MITWTGRQPISSGETLYDANIEYNTDISYLGVVFGTQWVGRTEIGITNTISPIITGLWNDSNLWYETGKYWNDSGNIGTVWSGRTLIN